MKMNHTLLYSMLLGLCTTLVSCRDEELNPYVAPEPGVHGFGQFLTADGDAIPAVDEFYSQTAIDNAIAVDSAAQTTASVPFQVRYVSIDQKLLANSMTLYVEFDQPYTDPDGNPRIAAFGGTSPGPTIPPGTQWTSLENLQNREPVSLSITLQDVYDLYKDATFDYGNGVVNVFSAENGRPEGARFHTGDRVRIYWRIHADNDLYFGSWSPSVCNEFLGANCYIEFGVD
ncbi:hypothetical protein SAMN05421823_108302 [Catalinimonas alkaloidigena]|uniref:Uncharacterized protein n=1 Tax=Catalinimonas alkaloidigena TaxID=1075417 RepID=A0A1G9NJF4_9BACT|nr:hypothetical protein [Catalinimonas alkaloidigena]SDL86127.1 hypothetical protein SAMN05421823_108302 [Catalinimonas alkaloidigena]